MRALRALRAPAWLRRIEDRIFALAATAEQRLRLRPQKGRIIPSEFDRRIVRLFVVGMPLLVATLFVRGDGLRVRLLFALLVAVCVALAVILALDAFAGTRGPTRRR